MRIRLTLQLDVRRDRRDQPEPEHLAREYVPEARTELADPYPEVDRPIGFRRTDPPEERA